MLTTPLIHPELLAHLAAAGHGSRFLLADGNYPHSTGRSSSAAVVHLNLAPGLLTVSEILGVLREVVPLESAKVMAQPDGTGAPVHDEYKAMLGPSVPFELIERFAFYDLARSQDVAFVVATGDERLCANLLVTIGVKQPSSF